MRAVIIRKPGGPETLELTDILAAAPQRGEVRIRVKATAVNRADVLQRMGKYPPPPDCPANVPGLEYAGEIDAVGEGAIDFKVGDRVFGLIGGGSYSEFITTHWRTVSRMPSGLSFEEAAALPEACVTAYDAMISQCRLQPGETVLIHAVGSGVGTAAVQIARAMGAITIGTTRTESKLAKAFELGMDHGIEAPLGKFAERVLEITDGLGTDVVLELNGGAYLKEDVACTSVKGRIIVVGLLAGATAELDLARVLSRRIEIRGTTMRARPLEEKIAAARLLSRNIVPLVEKQLIKPVIDKVFKLEQAGQAHRYLETNNSYGKVVLSV